MLFLHISALLAAFAAAGLAAPTFQRLPRFPRGPDFPWSDFFHYHHIDHDEGGSPHWGGPHGHGVGFPHWGGSHGDGVGFCGTGTGSHGTGTGHHGTDTGFHGTDIHGTGFHGTGFHCTGTGFRGTGTGFPHPTGTIGSVSRVSASAPIVTATSIPPVVTASSMKLPPAPSATAHKAVNVSTGNFNAQAQNKGKLWFGTEIGTGTAETGNEKYMAIFNNSNIFGQTTPGNSMKWEFTEPEQNTFTFSSGEETITLAKATDKKVRCHNLVWTAELPTWVSGGSWTNETLSAVMQTHITKEIEAYGDGCYSWDVVNEALSGSGYTSNVFLDVIGEAYVPLAFQYAEAAVKSAGLSCKLVYNDFGIESPGEKNTAAVTMIKNIQAQGIQIDGVGFESHFSTSYFPTTSDQMTAMKAFTELGLYVQVTELDVACSSGSPNSSELAIQAQAYYDTISACMQTEKCTGMTVWDFDDQYSWIQPSTNDGEGAADLFTAELSPKPAVTAVSEAIEGKSCSVCS